jgi:hypothetical protein
MSENVGRTPAWRENLSNLPMTDPDVARYVDRLRMDVASAQSRATTAERRASAQAVELHAATERAEKAEGRLADEIRLNGLNFNKIAELMAERDRYRAVVEQERPNHYAIAEGRSGSQCRCGRYSCRVLAALAGPEES